MSTKKQLPKCLQCSDPSVKGKRGLCTKHHEQYRRKRGYFEKNYGQDAAMRFEQRLIELKKINPSVQGKRLSRDDDVFLADVEMFESELRAEIDSRSIKWEVDELAKADSQKRQIGRSAKTASRKKQG